MTAIRAAVRFVRTMTSWHLVLLTILASLAAWPARWLGEGPVAVLLGIAFFASVRFLLLDTSLRRFWIVLIGLALLPIPISGASPAGYYIALTFTIFFLVARRYKPWELLSSAQRAIAFLTGIVAMILLFWDWGSSGSTPQSWLSGVIFGFSRTCLITLRFFWIFSLLHLLFGVRLHFLRLRPKLAVTAVLISLVPLLLLTSFGLVALYGAMGGITTSRGLDVLQEWASHPDLIQDAEGRPLNGGFVLTPDGAQGDLPEWLPEFQAALTRPAPPPDSLQGVDTVHLVIAGEEQNIREGAWAPADTAAIFAIEKGYWLLKTSRVGTATQQLSGVPLDKRILDRLSLLLRADVGFRDDDWGDDIDEQDEAGASADADVSSLQGHYCEDTAVSFWHKPMYFGGAQVPVIALGDDHFEFGDALMHVKVRLSDLAEEFTASENTFNQALLFLLGLIAILLLLFQTAAGFLGLRITNGIIKAVGALRAGTRRLAADDLDTRIDIPNEDEFGELAESFNDMAVAVKQGRQEAVARERLEKELETARAIQERLLPHEMPILPGFEVTGASIPCLQVGGDYFDFLDQENGLLGVAIGDVSGKGIPAALLMSNLQASLHGQVLHPGQVSGVVKRVNELLVKSTDPHMFATFFYGVLDRTAGTFTCTNAGHNPPLLLRADGELEQLETGGLPLGMLPDVPFEQDTVTLERGDTLLMYTDGITEAIGPLPDGTIPREEDTVETMFGEDRLITLLKENRGRSAPDIKETVLQAVSDHTRGVPQSDDITLVVVTRT